nr:MAG TPA: hypothetical protein [Caudoviricetes sp.]
MPSCTPHLYAATPTAAPHKKTIPKIILASSSFAPAP